MHVLMSHDVTCEVLFPNTYLPTKPFSVIFFFITSIDSEHNKETISLVQEEANESCGEKQYSVRDIKSEYMFAVVKDYYQICAGALSTYRRSLCRKQKDSDGVNAQRVKRSRQQRVCTLYNRPSYIRTQWG